MYLVSRESHPVKMVSQLVNDKQGNRVTIYAIRYTND